jgi:peptide/nickel transport system permease protein
VAGGVSAVAAPRAASRTAAWAWAGAIGRRVAQAIPTAIGVTVLTFLLVRLIPGDPARTALGAHARPEAIAALRAQWGLDRSLPSQYWLYLQHLAHGDLGQSLFYHRPATKVIGSFAAPTIWLVVYSALLAIAISVPVAVAAALRRGRSFDHGVRLLSQTALGMPQPWLGLLLILAFALKIHVFPVSGFGIGLEGHISAMFLPSLTVAIGIAPILIRALRVELLEVLGADYITTARAKGLRESRVLGRHALRNAAIGGVTILGLNIAWLVSGTVVVELVFGLPGLGSLLVNSILQRDFPLVQGLALLFALMVIAVNLATDILRAVLDPRTGLR